MAKPVKRETDAQRQASRIAGQQEYNARKGAVLPGATPQNTASGSIKDLSIGLAQQNQQQGVLAPVSGGGSIKDLSIGLAKGKQISQADIQRAQSGGTSLSRLTAPTSTTSTSAPSGSRQNPTSNQTSVAGGGYMSRYGQNKPVVEEPNYEDIQKTLMRDAQKEISALNKQYRSVLQEQQGINDQNLRSNASVNTLTGLAGSSEANVNTQQVLGQNQKANQKIQAEQQLQVQQVLSTVRKDAMEFFQKAKENYRADTRLGMEMDEVALTKTRENVSMLAGSGVTADGYKNTDPQAYEALSQTLGGEDVLKAMFTLNRPQEQILDKKIEGGKYIISYQNPLDGKVRIETVDLGLPPQYNKTIDAGDRILAIPENWSGDPSELLTINKGLTPSQAKGDGGSSSGGIYDQLDFRTANAVVSQGDKFNSSDIVKRFNNIQDARNNISGIAANTTNPADHQAIVYYFAKALDPESVVREGEYETIKKYAQNVFSRYRGELNNTLNGSGFLSADAISNIKQTIDNRYSSAEVQYKNKESETARIINTIAGKDVANMVLPDYGSGTGNQSAPQDGLSDDDAYQEYLKLQNGAQ